MQNLFSPLSSPILLQIISDVGDGLRVHREQPATSPIKNHSANVVFVLAAGIGKSWLIARVVEGFPFAYGCDIPLTTIRQRMAS